MSPRKFLRERKLLSMKNVDKAFRASTISYQITSDCARLSQFSYPKETDLGVKLLLPYHCPVWFLRSCLISSITGYLIGIRSLPPSWKYPTWLSSTGNKFVSYIHEMEKPHKNLTTIYGTTRHLKSLDVTIHH
jgi:hypothetical protein